MSEALIAPAHATAIEQLILTAVRTRAAFTATTIELERCYAPGKWCVRELLAHIVDTETVLLERMRRILAEAKPLLLAFDENRWAEHLHYRQRDMGTALALFEATRATAIEVLSAATPEHLARTGVHSEAGLLSLAQIRDKIVWHNAHHLEQVEAARAGRTWPCPSTLPERFRARSWISECAHRDLSDAKNEWCVI